MNSRKMALITALSLPVALAGSFASKALAHGSTAVPASREFFCRFMDPGGSGNPSTSGCKAVLANGGSDQVISWNEVLQSNANQRGLAILPEGQLCNAGTPRFRGLNLAPAAVGYAATEVSPGTMEVSYRATAPHRTAFFKIYLSKPSYDGSRPLMKGDLDMIANVTNSTLAGDTFRFSIDLPDRPAGSKAVMLTEWARVMIESGETYFNCSDLIYK
jgi:chitin-binding protein